MPRFQELDTTDYDIFTGGSIGIPITEREGGIVSTMLFLILDRDAWQPMTDAEWETQYEQIVNLIEKLSP